MRDARDDAYADELVRILTRPDPLEHDGVDREGGFGEEVWVESAEVEQGEHGAELAVAFGLVRETADELALVPPQGWIRLPFDAEWREQSGYTEPAAYAPIVAARVMAAARHHVEQHLAPPVPEEPTAIPLAGDLDADEQRRLLHEALERWGRPHEVAPGRIELRHPHSPLVTLLMTPEQWAAWLADVPVEEVGPRLDERMVARHEDETVVVFHDGDLHPSTREDLPPVRGEAWQRRLAETVDVTEAP